jgi:preprotein translocase SecF subunit
MKWRWIWIGVSLAMVALSLLVVGFKGINYSIDFTGGVEISMTLKEGGTTRDEVLKVAEEQGAKSVEVTTISSVGKKAGSGYVVRIQREQGSDERTSSIGDKVGNALKEKFGSDKVELSYANISGKIGKEEQVKGYMSVLFSLISILVYVAFRFDARFAPGAVICLFHDVIIALGFMTALGRPFSNTSIAAFLTIVGYSISDTIIVYDRVRELAHANPRMHLVDVVNRSINQTMSRTVLTSLTVWIALIVMVFWGGGAVQDFALTMLAGVIVGSYSSIYVAAPLTLVLDGWLLKRGINLSDLSRKKKEKDPNFIPPVVVRKRS